MVYSQRCCPGCGSSARVTEVSSDRPGETLSFDALKPHWSGFFKGRAFFSYARCGECGLLYAPTFFTPEQLGALYADMAPNMEDVPGPALEATQRGYWETAKAAGATSGGYLEIGPDIGFIVRHAAREASFDHFWLFEPNRAVHEQLADACEGRPNTILTDMDDLSAVPDGSVGLAVMIHVLDHLLDPRAMLRQIAAKLRPDGALVIVTHNEGSLLRRVMGRRFPPFSVQHPELYNPRSIARTLQRSDFAQVRVRRTKNYFPAAFMARQAALMIGLDLAKAPLPKTPLGVKLGNIVTIAKH